MSDNTEISIGLRMIPANTLSSLKFALRAIKKIEPYKDEVRSSVKYLQNYGALGGAAAHMAADSRATSPMDAATPTNSIPGEAQAAPEADIPTSMLECLNKGERDGLIAAVHRAA